MPKFEPATPESELESVETFVGLKTQLDNIEDELSVFRDKGAVSTEELNQFRLKRAVLEKIKDLREQSKEGDVLLKYYRTMIKFQEERVKKNNSDNGKKRKSA